MIISFSIFLFVKLLDRIKKRKRGGGKGSGTAETVKRRGTFDGDQDLLKEKVKTINKYTLEGDL